MSSRSTTRADNSRRLAVANGRVLAASVVAVIAVLGGEMHNPCDRVGPFSLDYYRLAAAIAVATLHGVSGK
jgi:hypothetical protein